MPMTPSELHAAVRAAITARLELAKAATPGPWGLGIGEIKSEAGCHGRVLATTGAYNCTWPTTEDRAHIAANDPAATIRHCEADLERLAEHDPTAGVIALHWSACPCTSGVVCPELRRLAKAELGEVPNEVGGGG